jgi:putative peptidoglycan lipid II flippase
VVAQAVGIAAFPTFSELVAQGDLAAMRRTLAATLRSVVYLALPASAGLVVLRVPIIELLFQRGEFTAQSTASVAWALAFFAVGLAGHAGLEIVVRAFYALHDTRTPVAVGSAAMALNVVLSIVLSRLFAAAGWMAHGGLALANSLATLIEASWLLWLLRGRLGGVEGRWLLRGFLKSGTATAGMAGVIWVWLQASSGRPALWSGGVGILLGAVAYVGLTALLRVEELRSVRRIFQRG